MQDELERQDQSHDQPERSQEYPDVPTEVAFDLGGNQVLLFHGDGAQTPIFVVSTWNEERRGLLQLAVSLGSDRPVYAVATPDFDDKYAYPRHIDEWVARARAAYDAVAATVEVGLIVGWSFGGVVAVHLAEHLRLDPDHPGPPPVLMIDSRHPATKQKADPPRHPVHSVLHHGAQLFEIPKGERGAYLRERTERIKARRLGRAEPETVNEQTTKSPLKRAIFVSWLKYDSVVLGVDGALLWCDDSMGHLGDITLGWGPWWRGRFESRQLGGGHFEVFDPGRVETVVDEITRLVSA